MRFLIALLMILAILCGCSSAAIEEETVASPIHTPTATPTPKPTPTPRPTYSPTPTPTPIPAWEQKLKELTLEQKIGQLFICAFRKDALGNPITSMTNFVSIYVKTYQIGGVILFSENIAGIEQTRQLIADYQSLADIPLFVCVDEEGGDVTRLAALGYKSIPRAFDMETDRIYEYGAITGEHLRDLGFNMDMAPVADIFTNARNTVIGKRAFSNSADEAAERATLFMNGLKDTGLLSGMKHFPGHGDTSQDSHLGLASANATLDELRAREFIPFKRLIDDGGDAVLVGHIIFPQIEADTPATFSRTLITDELRGELGFEGVVITDAMDMGAITRYYSPADAAVNAIKAGCDIILMPADLETAYNGVLEAVKTGVLCEDDINNAVRRILRLKYTKLYDTMNE